MPRKERSSIKRPRKTLGNSLIVSLFLSPTCQSHPSLARARLFIPQHSNFINLLLFSLLSFTSRRRFKLTSSSWPRVLTSFQSDPVLHDPTSQGLSLRYTSTYRAIFELGTSSSTFWTLANSRLFTNPVSISTSYMTQSTAALHFELLSPNNEPIKQHHDNSNPHQSRPTPHPFRSLS